VADNAPPAEITAGVVALTAVVEKVKVALVEPPGTVTEPGRVNVGSELDNRTVKPAAGAGAERVTLLEEELRPPVMSRGNTYSEASVTGRTVKVAWTPELAPVAVIVAVVMLEGETVVNFIVAHVPLATVVVAGA
jgi:hypothetical protein